MGLLAAAAIVTSLGCEQGIWFKGDFEAAIASAEARDTLIMMDFYSDW
jgi:hypothetical protein